MLSNEEIENLPDDPADAFAALAEHFEVFVIDKDSADEQGIRVHDASRAAEDVLAVIAALGVQDDYPRLHQHMPREGNTVEFWDWWRDFRSAVRFYRTHALMLRRKSALSVVLDSSHKAKIRALLTRIRELVATLQLTDWKRAKIVDLLSKVENQLDRPRTKMESWFSFILEGSSVAKQVGEDAKPLIEDIERITNVFSDAKDEDLPTPSLPAPREKPRIEDKRPRVRAKAELDDDIPF